MSCRSPIWQMCFRPKRWRPARCCSSRAAPTVTGFIVQVGKVELSREVGGSVQRGIFVGAGEILGVYKTLFENDARYFTGTVVEKSRITRIPEQVLKDRIAASDPFIIYCVRNWPNFGDRLIG